MRKLPRTAAKAIVFDSGGTDVSKHFHYAKPFQLPFLRSKFEGFGKAMIGHEQKPFVARSGDEKATPGKHSIRSLFGNAVLNFTHFVSTEMPLQLDTLLELLYGLMYQQAALQLYSSQCEGDLLIPMYTGDTNSAFNEVE